MKRCRMDLDARASIVHILGYERGGYERGSIFHILGYERGSSVHITRMRGSSVHIRTASDSVLKPGSAERIIAIKGDRY